MGESIARFAHARMDGEVVGILALKAKFVICPDAVEMAILRKSAYVADCRRVVRRAWANFSAVAELFPDPSRRYRSAAFSVSPARGRASMPLYKIIN
jgi:hypothetical protein